MRRAGNLWDGIVSFPNLMRAARRAALGKRAVAGVARFLERAELDVLQLQRELEEGAWAPGKAFSFEIHDPKTRTITAAPFRDRVVHHALIDALEPIFDRRMVFESFACRRGKGTLEALAHARVLVRRHDYFLKLDVRRFFPSIEHAVALETLERIVKDVRVLALCRRVLAGPPKSPATSVGLPIGNLTSQWCANLVLDRLDHHVKEKLRIPGYVRYMDDFVLFADEKAELSAAKLEVEAFLADRLRLSLKERATILAPATQGLPFLGWRIYRGTTRLRPENKRRTRRRLRHRLWEHRQGLIEDEHLIASLRSVVAHLAHGSTRELRRSWFENSSWSELALHSTFPDSFQKGGGPQALATA